MDTNQIDSELPIKHDTEPFLNDSAAEFSILKNNHSNFFKEESINEESEEENDPETCWVNENEIIDSGAKHFVEPSRVIENLNQISTFL